MKTTTTIGNALRNMIVGKSPKGGITAAQRSTPQIFSHVARYTAG